MAREAAFDLCMAPIRVHAAFCLSQFLHRSPSPSLKLPASALPIPHQDPHPDQVSQLLLPVGPELVKYILLGYYIRRDP